MESRKRLQSLVQRSVRAVCGVTLVLFSVVACCRADEPGWGESKGRHFLVYFENVSDRPAAERLLGEAEKYYRQIGERLGLARYSDFWTWDDRAKIFLFSGQQSFQERTRQPQWSTGFSDRDSRVFKSRTIVTYVQEENFFDGLLPHEISHLILHDFVPDGKGLPIWLDEGLAQLAEPAKSSRARRIAQDLVARQAYLPFEVLAARDIRQEQEPRQAMIFYAESLSVVEFLTVRYGQDVLARICRDLRDGKNFTEAMSAASGQELKTMRDLEAEWVKSIRR